MVLKSVKIDEELHDNIKFYCFYKGTHMTDFINKTLKERLSEFIKMREHIKFK
jgi:hypothetical protein